MSTQISSDALAEASLDLLGRLKPGPRRSGQVDMIRRVAAVASGERHQAVIEAPTGTGKALATVIPAVLSERRTVLLTATKMLQDQTANKDLPELAEVYPFNWVVLKGRGALACPSRIAETIASHGAGQMALDGSARSQREVPVVVRSMAERLAQGWDGDIDRAGYVLERDEIEMVTIDSDSCPGRKCSHVMVCPAMQAREDAKSADLIVTNMAMYAAHLASGGNVLPVHDLLVVDEMHRFENVLAENLGVNIPVAKLKRYASRVGGALRSLVYPDDSTVPAIKDLRRRLPADLDAVERFERAVERFEPVLARIHEVCAEGDGLIGNPIPDELSALIAELYRQGMLVQNALAEHFEIKDAPDDWSMPRQEPNQAVLKLHTLGAKLIEAFSSIEAVAEFGALYVEKIGQAPKERYSLKGVLVDVAPLLANLWPHLDVVMCSATVPMGAGRKLGLGSGVGMRVASPFDLARQGALYVAAHLPPPNHPDWWGDVLDELEALMRFAGGRTLGLFSSFRRMRDAVDAMRYRLPYRILAQGEGMSNPALIAQFSASEEVCLFGSQGLYEGIDVPGAACSLVVIDKVPFPAPNEPLCAARSKMAGDRAFADVSIPHARMLFAQAAGRLIRSSDDRGLVACFDSRLAHKGYGRKVIGPVEQLTQVRTLAAASAWLDDAVNTNPQSALEAIGF